MSSRIGMLLLVVVLAALSWVGYAAWGSSGGKRDVITRAMNICAATLNQVDKDTSDVTAKLAGAREGYQVS